MLCEQISKTTNRPPGGRCLPLGSRDVKRSRFATVCRNFRSVFPYLREAEEAQFPWERDRNGQQLHSPEKNEEP